MSAEVLDTLRERGFVAQVSDEPGLRRALDAGPITLYQGFDPTAPSLHTGNLVGIRRQLARYLTLAESQAPVVNNADWLLPLQYIGFLRDVGRHFTVNQ